MFCVKCGVKNESDAKFCVACGQEKIVSPPLEQPYVEVHSILNNMAEPIKTKKPKKKNGPIAYVLAVFLCIFIFIFSMGFLALFTVRGTLNENAINSIVDRIDITTIRVGRMLNLEGDAYIDNYTLPQWLLSRTNVEVIRRYSITERTFERMLEQTTLTTFVVETLTRYAEGLLRGDGSINVTTREIMRLVERNENTIYRISNYRVSQNDRNNLEQGLADGDIQNTSRLDYILGEGGVTAIRWVLSVPVLAALVLLVVLFGLIVFLVYGRQARPAVVSVGYTLIITGALFGTLSLFANSIVRVFIPVSVDRQLVDAALSVIRGNGILSALIVFICGIVMIAAAMAVIAIKNKKREGV